MIKADIKNAISTLKAEAKSKGFKLVYKEWNCNCGDFVFFIYSSTGGHYLVGFDGSWDAPADEFYSWENCYKAALNYINAIV